jgi:hypothetical protein
MMFFHRFLYAYQRVHFDGAPMVQEPEDAEAAGEVSSL